ncbi:hypothetical protein CCR75_009357 [Bremia lactucae]|uniref:Uncharacterized protein n=1 Tax=Bremia lactucae TaxID=4779 RepID=A0A976IEQ3_BRELC|nr:hypothetical protein CCR75_009357 [Bremia lactucae]
MDGSTTYCYYISQKYSEEELVKYQVLEEKQENLCPITIRVDVANNLEKNALIPLRYTATVDTSFADPNFEFPTPIVRVPVPDYLLEHTNASAELSGQATYDVAVANVVICDWRSCDIFLKSSKSSSYYSSRNNPTNFNDKVAVFGSEELVVPKDGKYTGYVHIVINVGGNSRADFVTFFPVQIGDVAGTAPNSIATDGTTTYCWTAKDVSVFDPSVSGDLTIRSDDYCPGSMSMSLSSSEVFVGETIGIEWKVDISDTSADDSTLIAEISKTDAIRNPRSNLYSIVPVAVFSGCQRNLVGANCSTYTGEESTTFSIAEFDDMNLTSNAVSYLTSYTFTSSGLYTMFGRVAMAAVDGERLDMAIYSSVTVSVIGGSGDSYVFLYVGIGIGAVILLIGLLFCYMKKRSINNVSTKAIPFRQPVRGFDRSSVYTLASSNFLSHKKPATVQGTDMSGDYSTSNSGPSYLAVNAANSGVFSDTIRVGPDQMAESRQSGGSFSLNPYDRASFADLNENVANSRPSDTSKFSFQSGYDDETDWEYDNKQVRCPDRDSNFSDFSADPGTSLPLSSTFDMNRGTNMPILEEDYLDEPQGLNPPIFTTDPRSTSSSGWTVN